MIVTERKMYLALMVGLSFGSKNCGINIGIDHGMKGMVCWKHVRLLAEL